MKGEVFKGGFFDSKSFPGGVERRAHEQIREPVRVDVRARERVPELGRE